MPSVIPARLQFQCGHAALVTLPRVKGETATQRTARIAREKTDALARQCDFCAPATAAAAVNGNGHINGNGSHVVEPTPVAAAFDNLTVVVAAAEPEPSVADVEAEPEVETEPVEETNEPLPTADLAEADVQPEFEPEVEADVEAEAETEADPDADLVIEALPVVVDETPAAPSSQPEPVRARRTRRPRVASPAPQTAAVAEREPEPEAQPERPKRSPFARGQRFRVEYQVMRILHAANIRDALRQANALGASEVVSIEELGSNS